MIGFILRKHKPWLKQYEVVTSVLAEHTLHDSVTV